MKTSRWTSGGQVPITPAGAKTEARDSGGAGKAGYTAMAEDKHTILVVDDDDGVRRVLSQWVQRLGYNVLSAENAEVALQVMDRSHVDVAICDVRMPGADGIWLADRIRERFPTVPVIMATGLNEMDPSVTLRPGVVAYVVKPFSHGEIVGAIKTGLAWREREQARPDAARHLRLIEGFLDQDLPT